MLPARLQCANLLLISSNHKKAIRLLGVHRIPSGLNILRRALHGDDVAFNREREKKTQCHKGCERLPYLAFEAGRLGIAATRYFFQSGESYRERLSVRAEEGMKCLRQRLPAELLTLFPVDGRPLRSTIEADEIPV